MGPSLKGQKHCQRQIWTILRQIRPQAPALPSRGQKIKSLSGNLSGKAKKRERSINFDSLMRLGSGDMKSPKITRPHLPTCGAPTGIELNGGIRTWGQSQTVAWMKQQAKVDFIMKNYIPDNKFRLFIRDLETILKISKMANLYCMILKKLLECRINFTKRNSALHWERLIIRPRSKATKMLIFQISIFELKIGTWIWFGRHVGLLLARWYWITGV